MIFSAIRKKEMIELLELKYGGWVEYGNPEKHLVVDNDKVSERSYDDRESAIIFGI